MKNGTAILTVSFGSSNKRGRQTVEAIEEAIGKEFPDCELRRAFACQRIVDGLKKREGLEIDSVNEALERAAEEGISCLVVQPIYLIKGQEYTVLSNMLKGYEDKFGRIALGEPLLSKDADLDAVIRAVTEKTAAYDDGETAVCFVGHGTESDAGRVYERMQERLKKAGYGNYYIGTLKAEPCAEAVLKMLKNENGYRRVVLQPLMIAAGSHVHDDMAGEGKNSWKSVMEGGGYEVECILEGLGEMLPVRRIYAEHIRAAMEL